MNELPSELIRPAGQGPRTVDMGQGVVWIKQGWQLFSRDPGTWLAIGLSLFLIYVILGVIPVVGSLAAVLFSPVFTAGMLLACRALDNGGSVRFDHLFAGFSGPVGPLVMVGVYCLCGVLLMGLMVAIVGGGSALAGVILGRGAGGVIAAGGILMSLLLSMVLSVPLTMAVWFAPALVLFRGEVPVDALKQSFIACLKNTLPFLLYGLLLFILFFLALLPLGLGLIVLMPVIVASIYAAYVDIFE